MIPVLMLAVLLAGRRLNSLTFARDETWTLINVGARNYGPYTPAQALASDQALSPDQAFGWTLLVNRWGAMAGWSTVAMRALPFFFGLLALAMVYGAGADMFTHQTGTSASLLLLSSSLVIQYFHIARAFTPVLLFSVLTMWSYWRVALDQRPTSHASRAGLLLGGIGLLYSHYFASLLLPVLSLFHLLFVRKNRSWWRTTMLFALMLIAATPELLVLGNGVAHNVRRYTNSPKNLNVSEALVRLLYTFSNGIVSVPGRFAPFGQLLLPVLLFVLYKTRHHRHDTPRPAWFLAVMAVTFLLLLLSVTHFVPVLFNSRMRYLLVLWPPIMLLVSVWLHRLGKTRQRMADWILASLVASGIVLILNTPYYRHFDYHEESFVHVVDQALLRLARDDDFLIVHEGTLPFDHLNRDYYLHVWEYPREMVTDETKPEKTMRSATIFDRIWLLTTKTDIETVQRLSEKMLLCHQPVRRGDLVLGLYVHDKADCA